MLCSFTSDGPVALRGGLIDLVNNKDDLVVCGEAEDQATAWKKINRLNPDMAIVVITLKDGTELSLIEKIRRANKELLILILSCSIIGNKSEMVNSFIFVRRSIFSHPVHS